MLGYVTSYKPEMKVREAELYKAYYCGVCKSVGHRVGQLPRMVLSYDAAFLAVMLDSLYDEIEHIERERCIANPFKKKAVVHSEAVDFAADVMMVLAWHKLRDDAEDENKKTADIISKFMHGKYEQLYSSRPDFCVKVERHLKELKQIEKMNRASLDEAAEAFAKIMEDIFIAGVYTIAKAHAMETVLDELLDDTESENDIDKMKEGVVKNARIMARIGYHLGKWIYLMDAYDDLADNIQSGAYNPLLLRYNYNSEDVPCFKRRIRKDVERNLLMYLSEMVKAMELLNIKKNKGIIENVMYVGLLKKTDELMFIKGVDDNE